jgi:uncharacterized protein DUF1579
MKAELLKEHRWLHRLIGEWTSEGEMTMEPGKPSERFSGTESVRSMGGVWVLGEGRGEMPGGVVGTSLLTLGYDPQRKRFVGTWIGSMMPNLWVYDGSLDLTERVLTLDTEGPGFANDGTMTKYPDVIKLKSDDHRVRTSHAQRADGEWYPFIAVSYRRRK